MAPPPLLPQPYAYSNQHTRTMHHSNDQDNVIIMTDAGKLIFSRYDDPTKEASLCTICGLIQTLRVATMNDPMLEHGDIQFINTSTSKIGFMHVGSLTLMIISYKESYRKEEEINIVLTEESDCDDDDDNTDTDTDKGGEEEIQTNDNGNLRHYQQCHQPTPTTSPQDPDPCEQYCHTEDYLKLQLEILYSAITFTLNDSILRMLEHDPYLDISYLLGSTTGNLRKLMDELSPPLESESQYTGINENASASNDSGTITSTSSKLCWLLGGVSILSPIPIEVRNTTSKVLATICSRHPSQSILYAILSCDEKRLFGIIQPHASEHQLTSYDLNLVLHYVDSQTALPPQGGEGGHHELWYPLCLPRLSSSGFVHCYTTRMGFDFGRQSQNQNSGRANGNGGRSGSGDLKLTLISQEPSTEEFQALQRTAREIRAELGGRDYLDNQNVLRIYNLDPYSNENSSRGSNGGSVVGEDDLLWERDWSSSSGADIRRSYNRSASSRASEDTPDNINRSIAEEDTGSYNNGQRSNSNQVGKNNSYDDEDERWKKEFGMFLAHFVNKSLSIIDQEELMSNYCDMASLVHFSFRYSAAIRHCDSGNESNGGYLSQLFGPPLNFATKGAGITERRVLQMYEKLNLILRLDQSTGDQNGYNKTVNRIESSNFVDGDSVTVEATMTSYDEKVFRVFENANKKARKMEESLFTQYRPSQLLHEEHPIGNKSCVLLKDNGETYIAMQGEGFEFYGVMPSELGITSSSKDIHILITTLIETIMYKSTDFFITQPLSFL